ncbi:FAD-binding domain-containing protein [Spiribacter vilamensis]|uniref:DNA photolyase-like FAD binding protein n=1 Tax=Spiribacter vilamensis TaxID=531306 RepID=A0A4Q8D009_9GAMM|nr:FAD-binding domain-containing protein [Spiribacter vilamensis]RZU98594.1 DNA photolyase-like FAD binding protein [Spiribacter vilamensis]TVO60149.1 DNA photolyase [Spiribacter vilamensis]
MFLERPAASHDAGLAQLNAFIPHAGADYARWRNHDFGPEGDNRVSAISPWLRHRLLLEETAVDAAIDAHGLDGAEKYVQEVCWRTYWKGFLERRPVHWHDYRAACDEANEQVAKDRRLAADLDKALAGETDIDAFNFWVHELRDTGYLHNHARMWFASIWVFTLELPWALGADFFLRHLLDGDPASNTLSWRWVAGLHTPGKPYIARSSNINKYTNGRFNPGYLINTQVSAPEGIERPPVGPAPLATDWQVTPTTGLLIHEDDLLPESLFGERDWPVVIAVQSTDWRSSGPVADRVRDFARDGLMDALARNPGSQTVGPIDLASADGLTAVRDAAAAAGVDQLLTPYVPTGPTGDAMAALDTVLEAGGVTRRTALRDWDALHWPASTAGFFRFWKAARPLIVER